MAEISEICEFCTRSDQVHFHTRTNGDNIHIKGIHLTQDQATNLAWLVNADDNVKLKFEIKLCEG